ncbi:MAG: Glu-tRNA(Gln) amidotransferase subunit GatE [Thermoplasmatota archaeon]
MDYEKIGFRAGLEIHQQLDTHKLFCNCQSVITEDVDYSFERFLRPTQSEMGDVDRAAVAEAVRNRCFLYTASNKSTCLVEADEEPPHMVNAEAVDICLTMAVLFGARPVDEIHFMRKIVIDGSNTGGFQRTALVAMNGRIDGVGIQTIALEEDAARKIEEKGKLVNYGLDRLGIPLVEIATDADIKNPVHAREVAERIGLLMHATGRVKRGLGTIRQDLNVSISGGARVEIKGIQSLSSITPVAEKEVLRQLGLIEIRETLLRRIKPEDMEDIEIVDLTGLFKDCRSNIVKKLLSDNGCAKGFRLPGFSGLLRQPDTRLGKELAVYAKMASGIGGILHSDELPGYGIENREVEEIKKILGVKGYNAFVIAMGKENVVDVAIKAVIDRAFKTLDGVPEEVRRALQDDSTEYMRPLPSAARMYPETDVPPIRVTKEHLERIKKNLPELPEEKHKRFIRDYGLNDEQTRQILASGYENDFEVFVKRFPDLKNVVTRTFLNTFSELQKQGLDTDTIDNSLLVDVFLSLKAGKFSKEAVPEVLRYVLKNRGVSVDKAAEMCGLCSTDEEHVVEVVRRVVSERKDFIKQRGRDSLGPIMGVVMKELRGRVDGMVISRVLKDEIEKIIIDS